MVIKRFAASAMALILMLSVTGCNNSDNSSSSSSKADSSSAAESNSDSSETETKVSAFPEKDFVTTTDGSAKVTVEGNKFMVSGSELWINGVNSAWDNWNDFGGNFNFEFWNEHFMNLHESGCNSARIWISCNGDVGMTISADGTFEGATTAHWEDLDDLFMMAETYQIYIMATVQSFDHYKNTYQTYESWRQLIQDNTKIDQYVDNYIVPLIERYGDSDYFWSVDLCNEPDWIYENAECGQLDWSYLQSYFARASAAIHEKSNVLVTVGMGMIKYNSDQVNGNYISDEALQEALGDDTSYDKSLAYVDFYSTHWYPWQEVNWGVNYDKSPEEYKQDTSKPCIIAEIPAVTNDKADYDLADVYEQAYNNGWQGVMAWKASGGDDGNGTWSDIVPAIEKMNTICADKIFPVGKK
ncbi:MAG: cellulase (glycosyl hydrolase family 5) [Hominimerdicola sp.]